MSAHILIVDDDDLLRRSLALNLEEAGYRTSTAATAETAFRVVERDRPDLVLLDIGLPGMDGLDALRKFQLTDSSRNASEIPIIFLTARRRELDQALGLELGADDYITKPFNLSVLLARIKAVLRRVGKKQVSPPATDSMLQVGDIIIDLAAHTVTVDGTPVDLSPLEFKMLHTLALEPGHVVSIDALLDRVWGTEYVGEPQIIYVHIRSLRQRLEDDPTSPQRIVTVRGVGYKLEPQPA
jgi:DNA-binding response OmpR family regulator